MTARRIRDEGAVHRRNRDHQRGLGNPRAIGHAVHITSEEALTWDQITRAIGAAAGFEPDIIHISRLCPLRVKHPERCTVDDAFNAHSERIISASETALRMAVSAR